MNVLKKKRGAITLLKNKLWEFIDFDNYLQKYRSYLSIHLTQSPPINCKSATDVLSRKQTMQNSEET